MILWRRGGTGERALLAGCGLTVAALLRSSEWYGGGAPPARYLVAMLPAFVLAGGMVLQRPSRWRRLLLILVPPSVVAWWMLITRPHLSINPGDGGYWLADALSRRFAVDAGDFFPSFLVPGTATLAVPLVMVVLVAAVVWMAVRSPQLGAVLRRSSIAVWLVASAALVVALATAPDRVVELEAPQVRRSGGSPVPAGGYGLAFQPSPRLASRRRRSRGRAAAAARRLRDRPRGLVAGDRTAAVGIRRAMGRRRGDDPAVEG